MWWPHRTATPPKTSRPEEPLSAVTDEVLLAEVHRRFGESWCSFSSAVRPRGACAGCDGVNDLTRHHLVPVAKGGGQGREIRARYLTLCRRCHDVTHRIFGPGDRYDGPADRELFVAALKRALAAEAKDPRSDDPKRHA